MRSATTLVPSRRFRSPAKTTSASAAIGTLTNRDVGHLKVLIGRIAAGAVGERTSWSVPSWVHTRADSTADMVTYRQPLRDKRNACYTTT